MSRASLSLRRPRGSCGFTTHGLAPWLRGKPWTPPSHRFLICQRKRLKVTFKIVHGLSSVCSFNKYLLRDRCSSGCSGHGGAQTREPSRPPQPVFWGHLKIASAPAYHSSVWRKGCGLGVWPGETAEPLRGRAGKPAPCGFGWWSPSPHQLPIPRDASHRPEGRASREDGMVLSLPAAALSSTCDTANAQGSSTRCRTNYKCPLFQRALEPPTHVLGSGQAGASPRHQGAVRSSQLTALGLHLCWPVSPPPGGPWSGHAITACSTPVSGRSGTRDSSSLPETSPCPTPPLLHRLHRQGQGWPASVDLLLCLTHCPAHSRSTEWFVEWTVDSFCCGIYQSLPFGII